MEAKDTVMSDEEIKAAKAEAERLSWTYKSHPSFEKDKYLLAIQAEISFKAGEQFGFIKGIMSKVDDVTLLSKDELADLNVKAETYLQTVRQEGIKKIKEEIENHSTLEQLPYRDGRELLRIIPESTRQELWGK